MVNKLYYGAAYYPELWHEEAITTDIRYMLELGINVVRMGEFAWSTMEPNENDISLDYFAATIDRLYDAGIETVMCTPTPTPPIWMSHGHPERLFVDSEGDTMSHGARQHMCTNNAYFRERTRVIVEAMAQAVGNHPGVIAWQIDNEFKCHVAECYCETCKRLWYEWLQTRYGTIERLNEAWGAKIWSEEYRFFDQVPQPVKTPFVHNASLSTAYRLFSQQKIAEYQQLQTAAIRRYSKAPVTHNTALAFKLDNERMFADLDFASFDDYPDCDQYRVMLMDYDLFRNAKPDRPFWVMETSPSHNGYTHGYHKAHRNGFLVAESVAAYASGAQGFSYWLWRQQRSGVEQTHGSLLSAWGKPTIGYANAMLASRARKEIEPIMLRTKPSRAQTAIVYSDRARAFFLTEPYEAIDYLEVMKSWYNRVLDMGIHRDLIFEGAALDGYKLLMTPFMPYISPAFLEKAERFVREGGTWIVGPLSGGRTGEHTVYTNAALGELEAIIGAEALFTYPIGGTGAIGHAFGEQAPLGLWSVVFETNGAVAAGTIEGGITPGKAFITEHALGAGKIVMLGSMPLGEHGDRMLVRMIRHYAAAAGIVAKEATAGTIVVPREDEAGRAVWIVVNMDGAGGTVTIPVPGLNELTGEVVAPGPLKVEPYRYAIVRLH